MSIRFAIPTTLTLVILLSMAPASQAEVVWLSDFQAGATVAEGPTLEGKYWVGRFIASGPDPDDPQSFTLGSYAYKIALGGSANDVIDLITQTVDDLGQP